MRIVQPVLLGLCLLTCVQAKTVKITLLATTDLHGTIFPYDYYTAQPAARGLGKIAKLVASARAANPNTVLIDCGDVIQGSPLESVYQSYVRSGKLPLGQPITEPLDGDPMMRAMNAIGYDAMALGNHEFNYGLSNLDRARRTAKFPWLSANTVAEPGAKNRPFEGYIIKQIGGVKVAIIGVTTPSIPMWEESANYRGYKFLPIRDTVARVVGEIRAKDHPDLVIVAAHSGLGRDLRTGAREVGELAGENAMYDAATAVNGVDAMVFGHTHSQVPSHIVNGVLMMQPKNWGISLGEMQFVLDDTSGRWMVTSKTSRLIPVTADAAVDETLLKMVQPYQDAAERFLRTPVATAKSALSSALARIEDTPIIDAIQTVQMAEAKADVSFASAFNTRVRTPAGAITVRQIAALYVYDNTLMAIAGTGRMVREALENSARYFRSCTGDCSSGPLIDSKVIGFNYDMAQGVEYEIDLRRPIGERVQNLRWHGKPLRDDQPLRIALNNYRAGGSGGYTMFKGAKVLWHSSEEIRDMLIRYYTERKTLPVEADGNWRIVPESAARELRLEAEAESRKSQLQ